MNGCFFQRLSKVYSKILVSFCPITGKRFFLEKEHRFFEKLYQDFYNSPPFERLACFYVKITGNFERFQHFNCEISFMKNPNAFQKTGVPFFS